ncbi:MAG: CopG family transcriptional regulator [Xenococcaceae cyanobacterium]
MNAKKPRKTFTDSLAKSFVYGESSPTPQHNSDITNSTPQMANDAIATEQTKTQRADAARSESKDRKKSIVEKLMMTTEREATVRLTVDLPESMHRQLSYLAVKSGKKKAEIVRALIDDLLQSLDESKI